MRIIFFLYLLVFSFACVVPVSAQYSVGQLQGGSGILGPRTRTPLNALERAFVSGQAVVSDASGNLRLTQYTRIASPLNVAYNPTSTGNTSFYSTFYRSTGDKQIYYNDFYGRSLRFTGMVGRGTAGSTPLPSSPISGDLFILDNSVSGETSLNFYTGAAWEAATIPGAAGFWKLGGNAGTSGSGFLGTTDNNRMQIGVNNLNYITIKPANSGVGSYGPVYLQGADAQANGSFAANLAQAGSLYESAFGVGAPAGNYNESWLSTDRLFGVYNGFSSASSALVVLKNGKVGIGVTNPTSSANVEIEGTIKINGGTPAAGEVLTCDAVGNATWEPITVSTTPTTQTITSAAAGSSVNINASTTRIVINPAALSPITNAFTINLPGAAAQNTNGKVINVFFGGAISAGSPVASSCTFGTYSTGALPIYGSTTTVYIGGDCLRFEWDGPLGRWRRVVL